MSSKNNFTGNVFPASGFLYDINSCDALRIIDGVDVVENIRAEKRIIAKKKFRAIDNDPDLERRILIYESSKNQKEYDPLMRMGMNCYVCNHSYNAVGIQHKYGICDDCLDVWDEDSYK